MKDENSKNIQIPGELLDLCLAFVDLHERGEYPSVEFAYKLLDLRDWLKENGYLET